MVPVDRAAHRLEALCEELGPRAHPLVTDLLDPRQTSTLMEGIEPLIGKLDILHVTAGSYVGGSVADGDPDQLDMVLNLNVTSAFRCAHAVLPHMIGRKTGDIVFTSLVAGMIPVVWGPVYTASKHAIQAFAHTLRRRVAPHGLRVGSVAPGPVVLVRLDDWPKAKMEEALANGSLMQPAEVADAVIYMLTRPRSVTIRNMVILPQSVDI